MHHTLPSQKHTSRNPLRTTDKNGGWTHSCCDIQKHTAQSLRLVTTVSGHVHAVHKNEHTLSHTHTYASGQRQTQPYTRAQTHLFRLTTKEQVKGPNVESESGSGRERERKRERGREREREGDCVYAFDAMYVCEREGERGRLCVCV